MAYMERSRGKNAAGRRALRVPKTLDERMIEKERNEIFAKAVA